MINKHQATFASKFQLEGGNKEATCVREIDGGLENIKVKLPAVLTADLRLNTPRYATLPNIMKAKKKPVQKLTAKDLGVDLTPRQEVVKVVEPPKRQGGGKVSSPEELVEKIKKLGYA